MSRLTHIDTDTERLPSGMRRIAYDADTQIYTFQDPDGTLWQGQEGAQYGTLTRKPDSPKRLFKDPQNNLLPPYQATTGCTRTSPNAPCSCFFCEASTKRRSRASTLVLSVAQGIKRTVSVRKGEVKPALPPRPNRAGPDRVGAEKRNAVGGRRGTL